MIPSKSPPKKSRHSSHGSPGEFAHAAISKHCHKYAQHVAGVLADRDPEELHQMRVGMRRLRSTLQAMAPILDFSASPNIKYVGKIARCLGEVRDLDVLHEHLNEVYLPHLPDGEQQQLKTVFKRLQKLRSKAFDRMAQMLTQGDYQAFHEAIGEWLEHPKYTAIAIYPIAEILADLLLPLISQLLLHPGWLVGTTSSDRQIQLIEVQISDLGPEAETLHSLRKLIKTVRYQTEFFQGFYGSDYERQVKGFQTAQEILGNIQDSFILRDFLSKVLDTPLDECLPTLSAQMHLQQATTWQSWRVVQQEYLQPEYRDRLRQSIINTTGAKA